MEYNLLCRPDLAHIYIDYPYRQPGQAALCAAADEVELMDNHGAYDNMLYSPHLYPVPPYGTPNLFRSILFRGKFWEQWNLHKKN